MVCCLNGDCTTSTIDDVSSWRVLLSLMVPYKRPKQRFDPPFPERSESTE